MYVFNGLQLKIGDYVHFSSQQGLQLYSRLFLSHEKFFRTDENSAVYENKAVITSM